MFIKQIYMDKKPFEKVNYGFDRTQMFKEYETPIWNRRTALSSVMSFCKLYSITLEPKEIAAMCNKFVDYIENGTDDWWKTAQDYLDKKKLEMEDQINYE